MFRGTDVTGLRAEAGSTSRGGSSVSASRPRCCACRGEARRVPMPPDRIAGRLILASAISRLLSSVGSCFDLRHAQYSRLPLRVVARPLLPSCVSTMLEAVLSRRVVGRCPHLLAVRRFRVYGARSGAALPIEAAPKSPTPSIAHRPSRSVRRGQHQRNESSRYGSRTTAASPAPTEPTREKCGKNNKSVQIGLRWTERVGVPSLGRFLAPGSTRTSGPAQTPTRISSSRRDQLLNFAVCAHMRYSRSEIRRRLRVRSP